MRENELRTFFLKAMAGCLLFALVAGEAAGEVVIHQNLGELTRQARKIFLGTCLEVSTGTTDIPGLGSVGYSDYLFSVSEWIRGGTASRRISIRQPRPAQISGGLGEFLNRSLRSSLAAAPAYIPGQQYVLFLCAPDEWGFTAPVGALQGAFRIERDSDSTEKLANGMGNLGLFRGMSPVSVGAHIQTAGKSPAGRRPTDGSVDKGGFLSLVRNLSATNPVR